MSELRKECYKCSNNSKCIADYGSIYCIFNRRYDFNNIDYEQEEDKTIISLDVDALKKRINNLKNKLLVQDYENYKERYEIKGMIKAYEAILNLI